MSFPTLRMRRLRRTQKIRDMVRETILSANNLVYPMFIDERIRVPQPISSMPGQSRYPIGDAVKEAEKVADSGVPAVILFGIPKKKDETGSEAYAKEGIIQQTIRWMKETLGEHLVIVTDICLCEYTSHGHCGVVRGNQILNDPTLEVLGKVAVSHADAGADIVAPSGMIDGQVKTIREALDQNGFPDIAIMAYSAKHASSFYGPFREAAYSTPLFGDRKSYQMDYGNPNEALREVELDIKEGADIVMVKPALAYLDLIYRVRTRFGFPTAAYNVSGEYAMIKAASERGWVDERLAVMEVLTAIRRAGANLIITYFARDVAIWMSERNQV